MLVPVSPEWRDKDISAVQVEEVGRFVLGSHLRQHPLFTDQHSLSPRASEALADKPHRRQVGENRRSPSHLHLHCKGKSSLKEALEKLPAASGFSASQTCSCLLSKSQQPVAGGQVWAAPKAFLQPSFCQV